MMRLHLDAASLTTLAAAICLPFFVKMMQKDAEKTERMFIVKGGLSARRILLIVALALSCNVGLTWVMTGARELFHLANDTQDALLGSNLVIQLIGLGIVIPVQEEVLFRGLVYQRLKDYNKGWVSILLASAFFAVYHGNALQILFAFPMSVLITWIYEKEKVLLAPILFHMTVNLSSVLITLKGWDKILNV